MALCKKSTCFPVTPCLNWLQSGLPLATYIWKNKTAAKDFASDDAESEKKELLL